MADVTVHLQRNLARYEREGDKVRAKAIRDRLEALEAVEEGLSMSNKKSELIEAAEAAGVAVDETMTKAEILEALNGAE